MEYISQVSVRVFNTNRMLTSQLRWSISVALYHSTMLIWSCFMSYLVPMRHFVSVCLLWSLVGRMRTSHTRQDRQGAGKLNMNRPCSVLYFHHHHARVPDLIFIGKSLRLSKVRGFWAQTIRWPLTVYEQKRISHEQGLISIWLDLTWTYPFFFFAIWRHHFFFFFFILSYALSSRYLPFW